MELGEPFVAILRTLKCQTRELVSRRNFNRPPTTSSVRPRTHSLPWDNPRQRQLRDVRGPQLP